MTVEENYKIWNDQHDWPEGGDEWSSFWGSAFNQWHITILPRIMNFIPCENILEIAPGHGRWTQFLAPQCKSLTLVDLSETCIEFCKKRFQVHSHLKYHVNDGKSLNFAGDGSYDFIFTFDSLVHVEQPEIESYIREFARVLKPNGIAFVHHSNFNSYSKTLKYYLYRIRDEAFKRLKIKGHFPLGTNWRARSMSYHKINEMCRKYGLDVLSNEQIHWNRSPHFPCDCFTVIRKSRDAKATVVRTTDITKEAAIGKKIFDLYR